jgi:putative MFS transporter
MNARVNAGARLDRLTLGPFHRRILILVGFGLFFDGFDNSMSSSILAALTKNHWSTMVDNAHFISATFLGLAVGAFMTGMLGDRFGRRFVYQFNLIIFTVTCVLAAMATTMGWLILWRGLMGVGVGAEYVVGYSLVSEFVPPQRRGWALGLMAFITIAAAFVGNVLGIVIIPHLGWRPMFLICGLGAFGVWCMRSKVPESPRWLEKMGRNEAAEQVLRAIELESLPNGQPTQTPAPPRPSSQETWVPISVLFSRPVIRRTLLAIGINIVAFVGLYSFTYWIPTFFVKQGFSLNKSLLLWTTMSFGNVVGPAICILVSDRVGRRRALIAAGLCCGVAALIYTQQRTVPGLLALGFTTLSLMSLITSLGVGGYSPELFATEYRLRGNGIAQMSGRIGVMLSPYAVVALYHNYGISAVMIAIASIYVVLSVALMFFGIYTNLRPLEELAPDQDASSILGAPPAVEHESTRVAE